MPLETPNFLELKATADLDFQEVLNDIGESIVILGQTMLCIPAEMLESPEFVPGGYFDKQDVVVSVRKNDFSTPPKKDDPAEFRDRDLRILSVSEKLVSYDLTLGDRNS